MSDHPPTEAEKPAAAHPRGFAAVAKHVAFRVARIIVIAYIGLAIVLATLQTWFIFPGAATQGRVEAMVRPGPHEELLQLTSPSGERVVALFGVALDERGLPHPDAASRPTILYFYGNGMCVADAVAEFDAFRRIGCNVIIPDYLGFGMSGGKAGEQGVYEAATAAWQHLMTRDDIDKSKIIVSGWSLGAAAAVDLAHREPVAGLMTFSAFTSMNDMARKLFPYLPTGLFLRHRFENEQKIAAVQAPVLIVHGRGDTMIPFDMSQRLKRAAPHAQMVVVEDGDHNDLFAVGANDIREAVRTFVEAIDLFTSSTVSGNP